MPAEPPEVKEIKPCIGGPYYFNPWPDSVSNRYEAWVDWQGSAPAYVDFTLNGSRARESTSGDVASHTYDLGRDLRFGLTGQRNALEIQAVPNDGAPSSLYGLYPIGIESAPWLLFTDIDLDIPSGCTGDPMKATWGMLYPDPAFEGKVTPPSWFPFVGGHSFGVKETQASLDVEFAGDGQGAAELLGQTGFVAGDNKVTGEVSGRGTGFIHEGYGMRLDCASFGLELAGIIKESQPLVDVICKAFTSGTCQLKQWESLPVVGGIIRWFNERAKAEATIEPGLDLNLNFRGDQDGLHWESGQGTGKIKATLAIILEAIEDLSAEGYGGGESTITVQAPPDPSYLRKLIVRLFTGVKLKAWCWESDPLETSYQCVYEPGDPCSPWCSRDTGNASSLEGIQLSDIHTLTDAGWHPIPRDYASDPATYAVFRANEHPLRLGGGLSAINGGLGLLATDENTISTNVFPESHPAIAADGSVLLLWVHDDTSKPLMQGEEIYYSVYNSVTWSTPTGITNDNLQDFAPQVAFDRNDNAIAVWERNKVVQSESSEFNADYANAFELAYAVWDGSSWSAPISLTNDNALDHAPVLVRGNDGILLLIWRQNAAGELVGTATNPDTLLYALWDGIAWSAPNVLLNNADGVLEVTATRHDADTMAVVYSRDADGDLDTDEDQELYLLTWSGSTWGSATRVTDDGQPDNQPTLFYDQSGNPRLLWLKGDTLYALLGGLTGRPQAVAVEGSASMLDYVAAQDNNGNLVLLWQGYSDEGVDIFYAAYDQVHNIFSVVEQLTYDEPLEKFMAPAFAPTGEMVMAYNKTALVTETVTVSPDMVIENVTTFGKTDLYVLRHTFGPDLTLGPTDLAVGPANPAPGSLAHISATLHNAGDRAMAKPKVAFYLGDPTVGGTPIGTATADLTLTGGMTTTVSVDWVVPTSDGPFAVYASADPDEAVTELDESNNTTHFSVSVPDLTVEGMRVAYGDDQAITLTVALSNIGVVATDPGTVDFRLDDPITGTLVAVESMASLAAGAETEVQAIWDATRMPTDRYKIYAVADPDDVIAEANETNNDEWAGVGILPDLVLRPTGVVTNTDGDNLLVSVWVFNEGQRDANGVTLGLYSQLPQSGTTPQVSAVLDIPAGEHRVATLNLGTYLLPGFYAGVGANGEVDDRDVSNNILLIGQAPGNIIYLPIVLKLYVTP